MARSGEATITVSIMGPPIPESCVVQSSIDSIVLIPQNTHSGLNGGTYEYFFSTSPTATSNDADYLGQGLSFTHTGLAFYTNYYYFIRSSNAYGKSSFLYVPTQTSNDVSAYLAALGGEITETQLYQRLNDRIDLIDGDGPGSVNERIGELQDEIDGLVDALAYVPTDAYVRDNTVRVGDNLWTAIVDVPAAADGSNAPPNPTYWVNSGQSIRAANAQAAQVTKNTADIATVDGKTTATATQLQALQASSRDDNGEGELADALKGWDSTASAATENKVRTSENFAMAQRITTLDAKVGDNAANITSLEQVVVTNDSALATKIDQVSVSVVQNTSDIGANSSAINTNTAAIQQTAAAFADTNGKLSTMWSVKMQVTADGKYVAAGIGLGIENTGAGLQSQFLVSADRFAIVNTIAGGAISIPFAVQGGQVFMNQAFIQDGTITNAKIGSYISSTNYIAGQQGWILNKDGTLEINGIVPGQGRLVINSLNVSVYDANNVLRVRLGYLG
jgi:predicted phage tail protein